MKKFQIQPYTLLISIAFFVLFSFFYSIMLKSFTNLPSEQWSKEIPIQSFNFPSSTYIASQYNIYDSIPFNDGLLLSYVDEKGIHIKHLNALLNVLQESYMPFQVNASLRNVHLLTDQKGHYQLILHSIDQKKIEIFDILQPTLQLVSKASDITEVETYTYIDNNLFYVKDHFLYGRIDDASFKIGSIEEVSGLTGYKSKEGFTLISVENTNTKRFLVSYRFSDNQSPIQKSVLSPLISDSSVSFQSVSAVESDGMLHVLTVLRNVKTSYNLANLQTFDTLQNKPISNSIIPFSSYIADPQLFFEDNTLKVGFIDSLQLGRIDVSRKYSTYPNYTIAAVENDKISNLTYLTKTENTKINPVYYKLNQEKVLLWMEYDGSHYNIYGSSNASSLIQASQHLKLSDAFGVFMNAITTYFPAFYASLALVFGVMLPVIILYGMLSFFKITWVERHGDVLLRYMIFAHILLKLYLFIPTIQMTLIHMKGLNFFYSTFTGQLIFVVGLTLISLINFGLYYKSHKFVGSFVHYLRFALIDCLLLITAFYPIYFV